MSERIVKIAIALSLLCLIASAVFYVSSINETVEPEKPLVQEKATKTAKPLPQRRGFDGDFDSPRAEEGVAEQSSDDELQLVGGDGEEEYAPEDLGGDGLIAGSVFLKGKDVLFDSVTIYLVQTKAYDPPVDEETPFEEESGEIDAETTEPIGASEHVQFAGIGNVLEGDEETEAESSSEGEAEEVAAFEDTYEYQEPIYLDENGEFEHILAPGEYKLVARAEGHTPVAIDGISVRAGEEVRGLLVELEEGMKVAGVVKVKDPDETMEEGVAPDGVAITLEGEGYRQTRYADAFGAFEFAGLPKGNFKLSAADSLYGKAEKFVSAGETTVTLELEFHHLTGTVVDEMGMPVADLEVIGRGNYTLPNEVDKDPYGTSDGMSELPPEELAAVEEQYAVTDENGNFTMRMANETKVTLTAQNYSDGSAAFLRDVDSRSRGVHMRLSHGQELKVKVTKLPEGMAGTYVDLMPVDEESPFDPQSRVVGLGVMSFQVPAGVEWRLSHDTRAGVEIVGALPSNVKMGPTFVRGAPRHFANIQKVQIHVEPQAQIEW